MHTKLFVCTESFHLSLCLGCLQEPLETGNAVFGFCICCFLEQTHPGAILVPSCPCRVCHGSAALGVPAGSPHCPRPFLSWSLEREHGRTPGSGEEAASENWVVKCLQSVLLEEESGRFQQCCLWLSHFGVTSVAGGDAAFCQVTSDCFFFL